MTDEEWGRWFAAHGPAVGEPMIDPELHDLDGNPVRLSLSWRERPAILVTASLTCPVARHQAPALDEMLRTTRNGCDRDLIPTRTIIYCHEAHPVGSPAPHGEGHEWVTPQNRIAGILHHQPERLEQRLELARRLRDQWLPEWRFVVDGMDNEVYRTFGTASCMGIVVDRDRIVRAKQGWLDPGEAIRVAMGLV